MGKTGYKTDIVREVELTQKKDDWQAFDSVTIAGITHKNSDPDTDNWIGIPKAGGVCDISYNKEKNTVVGTYQNSKNFGFVVPDDTSLGTDIFISKKNKNKAKNNQKVQQILGFPDFHYHVI